MRSIRRDLSLLRRCPGLRDHHDALGARRQLGPLRRTVDEPDLLSRPEAAPRRRGEHPRLDLDPGSGRDLERSIRFRDGADPASPSGRVPALDDSSHEHLSGGLIINLPLRQEASISTERWIALWSLPEPEPEPEPESESEPAARRLARIIHEPPRRQGAKVENSLILRLKAARDVVRQRVDVRDRCPSMFV